MSSVAGVTPTKDSISRTCSFCSKAQHEVRKLIAGPRVYICDGCIQLCLDGRFAAQPAESCSFCGTARADTTTLMSAPAAAICDRCLTLCSDILGQELNRGERT